jgi:prepilin peptidase CpaA
MLAAGFALFSRGWIGGGDAKLFAAAALWIGWSAIAQFTAFVAIAGGLLALGALVLGLVRQAEVSSPAVIANSQAELPYGIAIACGALIVYPQTIWARALLA